MREATALRRQWILLHALSSRRLGITVRAIAMELGVGDKTIRRDLDLLGTLGFPLEETVGEFGRKTWRLKSHSNVPPLALALDEAAGLYLAWRQLDHLAGTPFHAAAARAFQKVRAGFSQAALEYLTTIARVFHHAGVPPANYEGKREFVDDLCVAMEDHKVVHILYQSNHATEPAFRDVHPLRFKHWRGALYLIAIDPQAAKFKNYKIVRIEAVEITNFPFQPPPDAEIDAYLAKSFGAYHGDGDFTVRVHFAASVARYVEETPMHWSEKHTKQRDGSLITEYHLSCTEEIRSWVLSFGRKAVVIEPNSLREEIAQELEATLEVYRQSAPKARDRSDAHTDAPLLARHGSKPVRAGR